MKLSFCSHDKSSANVTKIKNDIHSIHAIHATDAISSFLSSIELDLLKDSQIGTDKRICKI